MKTIKSYLPVFTGLYNTLFTYQNEEDEIHSYNQEKGTDLSYDNFNWDYKEYEKRIAEACCEAIENKLKDLDIKVKFEAVSSPREYNFTNDSINCTYEMSQKAFDSLIQYSKNYIQAFKEYLVEHYKSRSGFTSFYSWDSEIWYDEYLKDEDKISHCFGALLEFYFETEDYNQDELLSAVSHELWLNFEPIKHNPS